MLKQRSSLPVLAATAGALFTLTAMLEFAHRQSDPFDATTCGSCAPVGRGSR